MPPRITRIASIIVSKKDARNTWKQKKESPTYRRSGAFLSYVLPRQLYKAS